MIKSVVEREARVLADPVQLQQVVLNLLRNAMEAMADPGCTPRTILVSAHSVNDAYVEIAVRDRGIGISSDVESTIVPQLLSELDGVEALKNVIVIGASNRQDLIDPAVLRPGRLDLKVKVSRPDREAAAEQGAGDDGAEALHREDAVDAEAGTADASAPVLSGRREVLTADPLVTVFGSGRTAGALVLAVAAAGYVLGRGRAMASAGGDARRLHSLPNYYGMNVALTAMVPAFGQHIERSPELRRSALVVDVRERGFPEAFPSVYRELKPGPLATSLLYLGQSELCRERIAGKAIIVDAQHGDVVAALAAAAGLAVGAFAARSQAHRRCWHEGAASMLTLEAGKP